jgi:hypothetical protein
MTTSNTNEWKTSSERGGSSIIGEDKARADECEKEEPKEEAEGRINEVEKKES